MSQIFIRGQNYPIEPVGDILLSSASTALEQGLTTPSAVSTFAYFLKSCCPTLPDKYCRILGFTPQNDPIFCMSLDSDEIVSAHAVIVAEFLKNRINRLDSLRGQNSETDKKISDKVAGLKQAIELVESGISRITIDALVETLDVGAGTGDRNAILPPSTTIEGTNSLREQIKVLQGQLEAAEKMKSA